MINELYIVGDQSRLVVKNIINQFKETDLTIKVFAPTNEDVDNLPNYSIHLLFFFLTISILWSSEKLLFIRKNTTINYVLLAVLQNLP